MLLCLVVLLEFLVTATNSYYLGCTLQRCEQICVNVRAKYLGYECECQTGYMVNPFDTNKCLFIKPACDPGFKNSKKMPYKCVDIDECVVNKPCQHLCINSQGSYKCYCKPGYQINESYPSTCDDVDECNDSLCEHNCTNTKGSFTCSCRDGFAIDPNNTNKCTDVDECSDSPCEETCINTEGSFTCSCRDGFAVDPNNKNKCTKVEFRITKADVILVFDASDSIGPEHFDKQFVFAKRLTRNFKLGSNYMRFGGVVFSRIAEKLFDLKDHDTLEPLHKALSNVTYMESNTYTHVAFLLIDKQQMFSADNGGREDAPDIVLLFTDGNPASESKAIEYAQRLKDSGVLILCEAIGPGVSLSVLQRIASNPNDVLEAKSYDTLGDTEKRLTQLLYAASKSSQRTG